jgi:hypothetical protein
MLACSKVSAPGICWGPVLSTGRLKGWRWARWSPAMSWRAALP